MRQDEMDRGQALNIVKELYFKVQPSERAALDALVPGLADAVGADRRFDEGDWVVDIRDGSVHRVSRWIYCTASDTYAYELHDGGYVPSSMSGCYRPWRITDARDGDILSEGNCILMLKELSGDYAKTYCEVFSNGYFDGPVFFGESKVYIDPDRTRPATDEEVDLLASSMAEEGYICRPTIKAQSSDTECVTNTDERGCER